MAHQDSHAKGGKNKGRQSRGKYRLGQQSGEVLQNIAVENNPTLAMFKNVRESLDLKHDTYEWIVKMSRDVTIESKRIIFSLHSTATDVPGRKEEMLKNAEERLKEMADTFLKPIASELDTYWLDPYPFHRAYAGGIEEFTEAVLFYNYIKTGNVISYDELKRTYFEFEDQTGTETKKVTLAYSVVDFVLGLSDFTGELMRKSINSLSAGQLHECFKTLQLCRQIQIGVMRVNPTGVKSMVRKYTTLSQSVSKMEQVCYTLSVRGNEVPTGSLIDVINLNKDKKDRLEDEDADEGIF